jgi:hypothetical protein
MDMRWDEQLSQVTAVLNYLAPMARAVAYTYEPPAGQPWRSGMVDPREVAVRDARPVAARLSLDEHGFAFLRQPSAVRNFYDEGEIKSVYYPEVEQAMKDATGAARVIAFDHNLRHGGAARAAGIKEPVKRAHNDFTLLSGPRRARDELIARGEDADALLQNRFAIVNLWRPIGRAVEESPLAVCDAASLALGDFVPTDLVYRDRVGETYSCAFSPRHRWFYVPHLAPDEALLLKCYDSAEDGRARFTAHTAFDDPTSPPGARPRESIETRTLVLFPPGQ